MIIPNKKILFLCLAAAMFTGCEKPESEPEPGNNMTTYDTMEWTWKSRSQKSESCATFNDTITMLDIIKNTRQHEH